jgi:hypothetical protein
VTASTLVEPAYFSAPPYAKTLGPEVAGICELANFAPDPEQRLALDAIFGMRPNNKVAALEAAIVACRQNIKTGLFKQCALGWLFVTDQRLIIWSAHEFPTAQEAFRDLTELIEGSDPLRKRIKTIHRGNGDEAIELLTGQRVKFKARTKTGGRGLSGDKVVLDEAFALTPSHMGSLFPLLSVRPDPQVVYGSSAGLENSAVLRSIRDRGRLSDDPGLIYVEWTDDLPGDCASPKCDHKPLTAVGCRMDDRRRWHRANTQLQSYPGEPGRRMTEEYVAAERRALPPEEFGRERLGWWDEDPNESGVFETGTWANCMDAASEIVGALTFAADVSPDRSAASIGVCGNGKEFLHLENVENGAGTDWIVPFLVAKTQEHGGDVVIDPASPAGSLIDDLKNAGVRVHTITAREYAQACGWLFDAVKDTQVRHLPQPELDSAVRDARTRDLAGGFAWDRRKSSADITPLVAVTLACWGFRTFGGGDLAGSVW